MQIFFESWVIVKRNSVRQTVEQVSKRRSRRDTKVVLSELNVKRIKAGISIENLAQDIAHCGNCCSTSSGYSMPRATQSLCKLFAAHNRSRLIGQAVTKI